MAARQFNLRMPAHVGPNARTPAFHRIRQPFKQSMTQAWEYANDNVESAGQNAATPILIDLRTFFRSYYNELKLTEHCSRTD